MSLAVALQQLANEVRPKTIHILEQTGEQELRWAPAGTSNHILWHAGHALWLGDVLCLEPITGKTGLPPSWAEIFGSNCKPVALNKAWPAKAQVLSLLRAQYRRMNEELARITDEQLDRVISPASGATLGKWMLHGLHDESNHQGEMYLLLKIQRGLRKTAPGRTGGFT